VRVIGVLKGDPVAALEPAADAAGLVDAGDIGVQLADGRAGVVAAGAGEAAELSVGAAVVVQSSPFHSRCREGGAPLPGAG